MRRITGTRRNRTAAAKAGAVLALLLVTCLGLAACGGSGSSTTNATNTNSAAKTTGGRGAGANGPTGFRYEQKVRRFVACMRANGVKLPEPKFTPSGPVLRVKGVEAASEPFRAGLTKCRGALR
jgi:hypothetical protein